MRSCGREEGTFVLQVQVVISPTSPAGGGSILPEKAEVKQNSPTNYFSTILIRTTLYIATITIQEAK